jgi:hypothetical protein
VKYLVMNQTCEWAVCTAGVFKLENGYDLGWAKDDGGFWCKSEDELNVLLLDEDPMCVVNYVEMADVREKNRKLEERIVLLEQENANMQTERKMALATIEELRAEAKKQVVSFEDMRERKEKCFSDLALCRTEKLKVYEGISARDELVGEFVGTVTNLLQWIERTNGIAVRSDDRFKDAIALAEREALPDPQGFKPTLKSKAGDAFGVDEIPF